MVARMWFIEMHSLQQFLSTRKKKASLDNSPIGPQA
jgi:hypothetical protein